jgi:hypothetical protein
MFIRVYALRVHGPYCLLQHGKNNVVGKSASPTDVGARRGAHGAHSWHGAAAHRRERGEDGDGVQRYKLNL